MTAPRLAGGHLAAAVGVALLLLSVTGCAPEETGVRPAATKRPASTEAFEPTAEPNEEPEEAMEPDTSVPASCDEILAPTTVQRYDSRLELHSTGAESENILAEMLGPATINALRGGEQQVYCGWGINQTDAAAYLGVSVVDQDAKAELLEALRESVYEEIDPNGAEAVFVQGQSSAHRYIDDIVIDGDLLVVASHTISGDFAWDAYDEIRR